MWYRAGVADVSERCRVFRRLHETGCFVMPNPWDLGSARLLVRLGFPALATTSSGFAWSLGRPDNHVSLEEALGHFRSIAHGVVVPVSADFEGGLAAAPAAVGANVAAATATGIAGLGVRRISVGGALARAAWTGFLQAAKEISERGTFTNLAGAVPFAEINGSFPSE